MATQTPWGKSQTKKKIVRGINFYTTASHGGYKVSKKLNENMPDHLRLDDGWYEEDSDWARVVIAFPQYFNPIERQNAELTLKKWNWRAYEAYFGRTLEPGESSHKDEQMFIEANKYKFQAVAAFGSHHTYAKPGHVVVIARKPSTGEEKTILVPKEDYDKRMDTYGIFVVNKNYETV